MSCTLIECDNISFSYSDGLFQRNDKTVLTGVSLSVCKCHTLGIMGSSGAGKTTLGKIIAGLLVPSGGSVLYRGMKVSGNGKQGSSEYRKKVQFLFQDPEGSLNPKKTILQMMRETARLAGFSDRDIEQHILGILDLVGLEPDVLKRYPFQLSGGQNQRAALGRILLLEPEMIILDEPTSLLDISVQAQILHLLKDLQNKYNVSYVFVSHDSDIIEFFCDSVGIIENGRYRTLE